MQHLFQHTATRRWLPTTHTQKPCLNLVSTHSHPKVAAFDDGKVEIYTAFQHTATRRWLQTKSNWLNGGGSVSTHSHPKVAAYEKMCRILARHRFNTQPPEGGCCHSLHLDRLKMVFQHTATRRWLRLN